MLLFDLLVQLLQPLILGRETAFRGRVNDENDFAFVFLQWDSVALFCSYQSSSACDLFWQCRSAEGGSWSGRCCGASRKGTAHTVKRFEIVEAGSRSHCSFLSLRDSVSLYLRTGSPLPFHSLALRPLSLPHQDRANINKHIRDSKTVDSC